MGLKDLLCKTVYCYNIIHQDTPLIRHDSIHNYIFQPRIQPTIYLFV